MVDRKICLSALHLAALCTPRRFCSDFKRIRGLNIPVKWVALSW
jgi:hypothetical protein